MKIRFLVFHHCQTKSLRKHLKYISIQNNNIYEGSSDLLANSETFLNVHHKPTTIRTYFPTEKIDNGTENMKKSNQQRLSMGYTSSTSSSSTAEVIEIVAGVLLFVIVVVFGSIFYIKQYGCESYLTCCCTMIAECAVRICITLLCSLCDRHHHSNHRYMEMN